MSGNNNNLNRPPFFEQTSNSWLITRYKDAKEVFSNPQLFSSKQAYNNKFGELDIPEKVIHKLNEILPLNTNQLVASDPPSHGLRRRIISKSFSKSCLTGYKTMVETVVNRLIDDLDQDECINLHGQLIVPFSNQAILSIIGFQDNELIEIGRLVSESTLLFVMPLDTASYTRYSDSLLKLLAKLNALINVRKINPKQDIVSRLIAANAESEYVLSDDEVLQFLLDIVFAGNDPVEMSLSSFFLHTLAKRSRVQALIDDVSLLPGMLHEAIRLSTGLRGVARMTVETVTLGGQEIPANSNILIIPSMVNRDKEKFEESSSYNCRRALVTQHLGFGYANHYCIGAALAEIMMSKLVLTLIEKYPNLSLKLDDPVGFRKEVFTQRMTYLNVFLSG